MSWVDELRAGEETCRRAPSAHNTQPWVLRYGGDEVAVHWDEDRWLADADPTRRDLFLSLGAFVETCLIVAADAGLPVRAEVAVHSGDHRVARLVPAGSLYRTTFTSAAVRRRRCARGRYVPGPVAAETLDRLTGYGGDVRRVDCRRLVGALHVADRWLFGTPPVAGELREWLRLSPRHPRYHLDGLTDRALELSRVEAAGLALALAPRVYPAGRALGLPGLLAAASRGLLRHHGSVLVLVGRSSSAEDVVEHGRTLMRVWLALSETGLAVHPLSQILDCQATSAALGGLLELSPDESALAIFRAGRPRREPSPSARIPVGVTS
jgi:hypothetical protein